MEATALAIGLIANVTHKLSQCLAEERLEAVIILDHLGHKVEPVGIVEAELKQVSEVYKQGDLLLADELVRLNIIVLDWRSISLDVLLCSLDIRLVIHIIFTQLEAKIMVRV